MKYQVSYAFLPISAEKTSLYFNSKLYSLGAKKSMRILILPRPFLLPRRPVQTRFSSVFRERTNGCRRRISSGRRSSPDDPEAGSDPPEKPLPGPRPGEAARVCPSPCALPGRTRSGAPIRSVGSLRRGRRGGAEGTRTPPIPPPADAGRGSAGGEKARERRRFSVR